PLVALVTDVAGDAYENGDAARDGVRFSTVFTCAVTRYNVDRAAGEECFNRTRPYDTGSGMPRRGRAADPSLDILSVGAAAGGEIVAIELEAGRLTDAFDSVTEDSVGYQVCWDSVEPWAFNGTLCDHGVVLFVAARADGPASVVWSALVDRSENCVSDWWAFNGCLYPVPYELEAGSPGKIRWNVPRALLGNATDLPQPFAVTQQGTTRALYSWPFNCLCSQGGPNEEYPAVVDATSRGEALPLPPRRGTFPAALPGAPGVDEAEDWLGEFGRSVSDVLSTTLVETETNLTLSIELAEVPDEPPRAAIYGHFGLPGRAYWAGIRTYDSEQEVRAISCEGRSAEGWCSRYTEIPVQVVREPGTPGRVAFSFARSDLDFPIAGDTVHSVWAVAHALDRPLPPPPGAVAQRTGDLFRLQFTPGLDFGALAPTMRLQLGAPPRILEGLPESFSADDDSFDAEGTACRLERCNQFDITNVELAATGPTSVDVTIGIADLSQVRVPTGYHSVVYAAGVRTSDAQTMIAYSRDEDNQDKFFCAPDNLVLVGTPLDPSGIAATPITGLVTFGLRERVGTSRAGDAAPGSITIHVPYECFGRRDPGPLRADALGTGTYVIRNLAKRAGEGEVERLDTLQHEGAIAVASVAPPAPPPDPWYARDIFYNALGVFLAVVTVGFTLVVYWRRRRLMQWYLDELTRIDNEYREDSIGRAKGVLALRKRLHHDIVKHRVSDSEYIRDRLRGSLTSARLVSLSDDYFDLPAPLTLRIERVLDDGRMTAEEGRLVEKVMNRVKLPEAGRALLIERIRTWVAEDASWG
ncbi:MAG TPA: hypothetical protein VI997_03915, partial [Candidatus Thermoplasmatota archaeon]|nr:hypothetical protein [Candidatus Thermoplasmatota archaeon]